MTNQISELLRGASRAALPVVRGVADERLGEPTPCAEYTVRDLLNHLFHVVVGFQALAAKETADFTTTPDYLAGDWRRRFEEETVRLAEAWSAPDALEGTSQGMGLPQLTVAHMVLGDLTVHAWDLARATGASFTPDAAVLGEVGPAFAEMAPMARQAKVFGEPFPVPEGASAFEELLCATGRDPGWRAEAGNGSGSSGGSGGSAGGGTDEAGQGGARSATVPR